MPVTARRVTVANTATAILTAGQPGGVQPAIGRTGVLILNPESATQSVFVGGSAVTTAAGFELAAGKGVELTDLGESDAVYGIVASGTQVVHVLEAE